MTTPEPTPSNNAPVERSIWEPGGNWAQWALLQCPVFEIFFGGARGGGKTDGMLGEWAQHANRHKANAIGMMLRRTRTELLETIERSRQIYKPLGWAFHEQDKVWKSPEGARLRFAYLERDADAELYQGHSYTRIYVEEAGNFPVYAPIAKLMATLRSGAGVSVGIRLTGNPGGPGHQWVKQRYVDPAPLGNIVIADKVTGLERIFIPSKVDNNVFIDVEAYKQRLRSSGSAELVRAWLDGDFSVTLGAFFDCWDSDKHIIPPFLVPKDWLRFRSMDWGSATPFCVQWWAIVQDDYQVHGHKLPRGCMVCYREWYGCTGEPNVGIKMPAEELGQGILEREQNEEIAYGVLDPSAYAEPSGPSIAERLGTGTSGKIWFRKASNTRVSKHGYIGGWDSMRARLKGYADGLPMMVFFSTCVNSIRTIPFLQHDPDRHEDVATDMEDHCADAARYASMSRPWVPVKEVPKPQDIVGYRVYKEEAKAGDWKAY